MSGADNITVFPHNTNETATHPQRTEAIVHFEDTEIIASAVNAVEKWMNTHLPYESPPSVNAAFTENMIGLLSVPAHDKNEEIIQEDSIARISRIISISTEFILVGVGVHTFLQQVKNAQYSPLHDLIDEETYETGGFKASVHDWEKLADPKIFEQVISAERFGKNSPKREILNGHAYGGSVRLSEMAKDHSSHTKKVRALLKSASKWAKGHHERLDGSGYPFGISEEAIDIDSRIMAIHDMFYALTEKRPYHPGRDISIAFQILEGDIDSGKLDSTVYSESQKYLPESLTARNKVREKLLETLKEELDTTVANTPEHLQSITREQSQRIMEGIYLRKFTDNERNFSQEVSENISANEKASMLMTA